MTLTRIAMRNLLERKAKAAFILAGLVIGVATAVAVISYSQAAIGDINHKLERYGANILIMPKTENLSLSYGGMALGGVAFDMAEIRQEDLSRIRTIPNVRNIAAVGPMVLGPVAINGRTVLLAGMDFTVADMLKPWWKINGTPLATGNWVAGAEAARQLGIGAGDSVSVGDARHAITGIIEATGSQDDHLVFAPLAQAQEILGKQGRISMVEVAALCHNCPVEEMVKQLSQALPGAKVMAIAQVVKGRMDALARFRDFTFALCAAMVLVGSLVVLVTMMASVRERTAEIGILRAIGFRQRHIMRIVLLEAGMLSALAGLLGWGLGLAMTYGIKAIGLIEASALHIDPMLGPAAVALALVLGLGASCFPAFTAARLDPNEALRAL